MGGITAGASAPRPGATPVLASEGAPPDDPGTAPTGSAGAVTPITAAVVVVVGAAPEMEALVLALAAAEEAEVVVGTAGRSDLGALVRVAAAERASPILHRNRRAAAVERNDVEI